MRIRRCGDIAATVLAIATIGGLAVVSHPHPTPTGPVPTAAEPITRPVAPPPGRPSVLLIGDSYTGGPNGLPELSYGCQAASAMGWLCHLSAVPGTGYISGGPANRFIVDEYIGSSTSFSERVPRLSAQYQPDIVILDGGRNDEFPPRDDVYNAMAATIGQVRHAWPTARIVFIRPRFLDNPGDDLGFDDAFIRRLSEDPDAAGMTILDPVGGFVDDNTSQWLLADGVHPNLLGDKKIAIALIDALESHGFAATM